MTLTRSCLALVAVAVLASACGSTTTPEARNGPPIVIASYDTVESTILAEIYARALRDDGYEVTRVPAIETRQEMYEAIASGQVDFATDYLGTALSDGFAVESVPDADSLAAALSEALRALDATLLDYAPAENRLVFAVTRAFAAEHELETLGDLAAVAGATLGGPPECEELESCFLGLVRTYDLSNLQFELFDESEPILPALLAGEIHIAQFASTRPILAERGLVPLTDDLLMIAAENVVPILRNEIVETYGSELTDLVDSVSAEISTDVLVALNANVEAGAASAQTMAQRWIDANF